MNYKIVDNFLEKNEFLILKKLILSNNFPWFYTPDMTHENKINKKDKTFYFIHFFYVNNGPTSSEYKSIVPILDKMKCKSIIRIKANFYPNQNKYIEHEKHVDYPYKHKGAIFFINTNNGFTILEDGTKIESIENRMLFFDPSKEHNSTNCTDDLARVNINFNYF